MIIKIHKGGSSFKGLATYLTHDPKAKTDERVGWTHTLNLANDHVPSAVDEMLWTSRSAELLKQEAGVRAGGRTTKNDIKHVSLNWSPDEKPTREHMVETAEAFLRQMKWQEHQALVVAHEDKDYAHVHLMINTVHPETGRHLDDNFDKRRAQKWALGYEQENGRNYCEQRLDNMSEREKAPTRPAWMAFDEKKKEFERDEKALAEQTSEPTTEEESVKVANLEDWKKLKDFQRQERTDFFGEGKAEFSALRRMIYREVREDFRGYWADYYSAVKNGDEKDVLERTKKLLMDAQKEELGNQRDQGYHILRDARDEQYRILLDYQQDTRDGFRARQNAGLDSTLFFQQLDQGSFRDRYHALQKPVSAETVIEKMYEEPVSLSRDGTHGKSYRRDPYPPFTGGHYCGPTAGKGADIGSDLGMGLIFLLNKVVDGSAGGNAHTPPQHTEASSRDPFDGVAEDARKRQQAEKENADEEWRRKQRSYGD